MSISEYSILERKGVGKPEKFHMTTKIIMGAKVDIICLRKTKQVAMTVLLNNALGARKID